MKRRAVKVVVFLLLGAIINVAVAWCLAAYGPFTVYETEYGDWDRAHLAWWNSSYPFAATPTLTAQPKVDPRRPGMADSIHRVHSVGMEALCITDTTLRTDGPSNSVTLIRLRFGWPFSALQAEYWNDRQWGTHRKQNDPLVLFGRRIEPRVFSSRQESWSASIGLRLLPLHPLVVGSAINTIFYAAVLWVLFALPFVVRRRGRIKRGLCPACAYPVGGSPVCTECGKPVVKK